MRRVLLIGLVSAALLAPAMAMAQEPYGGPAHDARDWRAQAYQPDDRDDGAPAYATCQRHCVVYPQPPYADGRCRRDWSPYDGAYYPPPYGYTYGSANGYGYGYSYPAPRPGDGRDAYRDGR